MNTLNKYRYQLDKTGKKFICPKCGKRRFVRFRDNVTDEYLSESFGRCDREINCGYFQRPDNSESWKHETTFHSITPVSPSFIPMDLFNASLRGYSYNNFILWLKGLFDEATVRMLIVRYQIGTSKHWKGSVIFWQVDTTGRVCTGKIMLYDEISGKRIKEPFSRVAWVHKVAKMNDFKLKQCLYGEHLLKGNFAPVALVESEKTAVVASVYFPNLIWLATGSENGLTIEKCKPLAGRRVILFPDLKCYSLWSEKAKQIELAMEGTSFAVSRFFEQNATEEDKAAGLDIADYLIRDPLSAFRNSEKRKTETLQTDQTQIGIEKEIKTIGDFFDLLKEMGYEHLPKNLVGVNTGIWKTQIAE